MKVTTEQHWRVFCALELPQHVCDRVLRHIAKLKELTPKARASWARATNLHLTIKFLGDIPPHGVGDLSAAAARAGANVEPFLLRLDQSGVFPQRGPAKVLWLGVEDLAGTLTRLQTTLEDECAQQGLDWREVADQRGREREYLASVGVPEAAMPGGNAPAAEDTGGSAAAAVHSDATQLIEEILDRNEHASLRAHA